LYHPRGLHTHTVTVTLAVLTFIAGIALDATTASAFPLDREALACTKVLIRDSGKVISAYGKAVNACVRDITRGRSETSDAGSCVASDPRQRLAQSLTRQRAKVLSRCSAQPYPMDCQAPCEAADAGGPTSGVDGAVELANCLQCVAPATSIAVTAKAPVARGAHGRVLLGVNLEPATSDRDLAGCQAGIVRGYDRLVASHLKEASRCISSQLRDGGGNGPPMNCVAAATQTSRSLRARDRLAAEISGCSMAPFDAGECAGAVGHPALTDCLSMVSQCALCRWAVVTLGADEDCDLVDDGAANASCTLDGSATTTTTVMYTTTTEHSTTSTTTTTLPPGSCGFHLLSFGSSGGGPGLFNGPRGIAAAGGNVYVGDSRNHRINAFSTTGGWMFEWGSIGQGAGEFDRPRGMVSDSSGNVFIADRSNHRVQKFGPGGQFLLQFGSLGTADGQFNQPRGVAVDSSGNIYVTDSNNNRVQKFSPTGAFISSWGSFGLGAGQFNSPRGIAVGPGGTVYVVDQKNNRVHRFDASGNTLGSFGQFGVGPGQFNQPHGIATNAAGDVFIVDTDNHRVQVFTANGVYLDQWGAFGSATGQFSRPNSIAIDPSGNVFVSDLDNDRVQKFSCVSP
jgi:DNA-binding beta-propeller fold protein YncE